MTDPTRLRILQVNSSDVGGGAERIALRLHQHYLAQGYEATLAVGRQQLQGEPGILGLQTDAQPQSPRGMRTRISGVLRDPARKVRQQRGIEEFDYPASRTYLDSITLEDYDVVHLHNLHGDYFDLRIIEALSGRLPVVVTMHDAWMLSGHCAHSLECEKWVRGCGPCPDLDLYPAVRRDATRTNWQRKRQIYSRSQLHVVTPAQWLAEKVTRSILAPAATSMQVINNGIDLRTFSPGDRVEARRRLGLPADARIGLFVAQRARSNPYKDWALLRSALDLLPAYQGVERVFLTVGELTPDEELTQGRLIAHGPVAEPERMAEYFRAADVYVHAARADTFPSVVLEAMACGTPVIATAVDGIVEQVVSIGSTTTTPTATGLLVPRDPQVMANAIGRILDDAELGARLGAAGRARAVAHFDEQRMVSSYLDLYGRARAAGTQTLH